jgi:hypothetical protein
MLAESTITHTNLYFSDKGLKFEALPKRDLQTFNDIILILMIQQEAVLGANRYIHLSAKPGLERD